MTKLITLTEDEFYETYLLVPNHINPNELWTSGDEDGCFFEPHGKELKFIRRQDPRTVWTFLHGDDQHCRIVSGFHTNNKVIGYLISTTPIPNGVRIRVRIPVSSAVS
jgi:hypothetical protein